MNILELVSVWQFANELLSVTVERYGLNLEWVKDQNFILLLHMGWGGSMSKLGEFRPIRILLVEDNPGDVRLVQEIFKEGKLNNTLDIVRDGVEAMQFLRQEGEYQKCVRPDLVLLDLNLPRKNGSEVLAEIKEDRGLRRLPVIVLTASQAEEDIVKAYFQHANCYLTKPIDLDQFIHLIKAIKSFWLTIVQFPEE
jgi:CheY-like chemotaxis protein